MTNHLEVSPRQVIMNYARRNGIEDGLGTNVNFFHLDCLASEVRLNVQTHYKSVREPGACIKRHPGRPDRLRDAQR